MKKSIFISLFLFLFLFASVAQAGQLVINYGYEGKHGKYGIADTAIARLDGMKIADAQALEIVKRNPGPNSIKVRETHYNSSGSIVYQGYIEFQFTGMGAENIGESAISGIKRYNIFRSWPEGSPGFGGGIGGFGGMGYH